MNVSGVQLQHKDFAERVLDIAAWSRVDPHQLVIEVTESVFFDADSHVIQQLITLRAAGIGWRLTTSAPATPHWDACRNSPWTR